MTLIELLTVGAVISLLVQLLIPAVQAARESSRCVSCANNLRQMGTGILAYESARQTFPSGGWSSVWMADPSKGVGVDQPGGWTYSLLPFIEENARYNPRFEAGDEKDQDKAVQAAIRRLMETPVGLYHCPSRRAATLYLINSMGWNYRNYQPLPQAVKCDYAANAGDHFRGLFTTLKDRIGLRQMFHETTLHFGKLGLLATNRQSAYSWGNS